MGHFFRDVFGERGLRMWVNNPTLDEARKSIADGAVACTTNPTYPAKTIEREHEYACQVIDEVKAAGGAKRDVANRVMAAMVKRIADEFLSLYQANPGVEGFVSIQPNPFEDTDAEKIVADSLFFCSIAENIIPKIPATKAGLMAVERLLEKNIPVLVTEVMSIAQAVYAWNLYEKVAERTGNTPPYFVTHITGIFDEYLAKYASSVSAIVDERNLDYAGTIVAQKQYREFLDHKYAGRILGGGARNARHFLNMAGMEMDVTINWSMAEQIRDNYQESDLEIKVDSSEETTKNLLLNLPDFRRAYDQHGLSLDEFEDYGPVQRFRNAFLQGWKAFEDTIEERRTASKKKVASR